MWRRLFWVITAPFWPIILTLAGDRSPLLEQRLVETPSGPWLPATMLSVNFDTGASGMVSKFVASRVPPGMETRPTRSSAMSPRSRTMRSGNPRPGCLTKKAPPVSGSFNNGVCATAEPACALAHLPAWYSARVQALLTTGSSAARVCGSATDTDLRLLWPGVCVSTALNGVELPRLVCLLPPTLRLSLGANLRFLQLATWNGDLSETVLPSTEVTVPATCCFAQFVGATMKRLLSTATRTERMCSGTPFWIVGNSSETTVSWAVR